MSHGAPDLPVQLHYRALKKRFTMKKSVLIAALVALLSTGAWAQATGMAAAEPAPAAAPAHHAKAHKAKKAHKHHKAKNGHKHHKAAAAAPQ
jgi:hypothetical protein